MIFDFILIGKWEQSKNKAQVINKALMKMAEKDNYWKMAEHFNKLNVWLKINYQMMF